MIIAILTLLTAVSCQDSDHVNPNLAESVWPIAHMNSWNTDSSPLSGPSNKTSISQRIFKVLEFWKYLDPITILSANHGDYYWSSSMTGIFKLKIGEDKKEMKSVGYMWRDFNSNYHGAYAFVAKSGIYYAAGNDYIAGYNNVNVSDPESEIVTIIKHTFQNFHSDEHIVGVSATYDDGNIVWISNYGKVGVISQDFNKTSQILQCPGLDTLREKNHMVTNSFALDKHGGIFVVSSMYMNKFRWSNGTLTHEWST